MVVRTVLPCRRSWRDQSRDMVASFMWEARFRAPALLRSVALIRRSSAADVVALAGSETGFGAGQVVDQGGDFLRPAGAAQGNARHHVIDGGLRDDFQDRRGDDGRRDG